ncbi:TfoX/Sxy family protein [Georgenia sp. Z1344]|uniref:TfoX/Sxy family protein n=1 Tax=Georgenia sp. Z1344 TaxID=3416706 RepID=UPI003CF1E6DD
MTPEQTVLVERLRARLTDQSAVREVSMFGGRSVMVNEKMIVSALKDGGLLVRVDKDRHDELLDRPGAAQAEMGPGRDMGPGWIEVSSDVVDGDDALDTWVEIALEHNRRVTGGGG